MNKYNMNEWMNRKGRLIFTFMPRINGAAPGHLPRKWPRPDSCRVGRSGAALPPACTRHGPQGEVTWNEVTMR